MVTGAYVGRFPISFDNVKVDTITCHILQNLDGFLGQDTSQPLTPHSEEVIGLLIHHLFKERVGRQNHNLKFISGAPQCSVPEQCMYRSNVCTERELWSKERVHVADGQPWI